MTDENKNEETKEMVPYMFSFTFKAGGIVTSDLSAEELKERIAVDLAEFYGEDGFEITEVRPATEDELQAVTDFLRNADNEEVPTIH